MAGLHGTAEGVPTIAFRATRWPSVLLKTVTGDPTRHLLQFAPLLE